MTKMYNLLLMLLVCVGFCACNDDDDLAQLPISFQVSTEKMLFLKSASSQTLFIESPTQPQITSDGASWLTVGSVALNGDSKRIYAATLTVAENTGYDDRSATITVNAGSSTATVAIVQSFADGIAVAEKNVDVAYGGSQLKVTVQSTGEYTVDAPEWIHRAPQTRGMETSTLNLVVDANMGSEREAEVTLATVADPNVKATFTVKQEGFALSDDDTNETAMQSARNMNAGWNIGNTLEATGGETAWGNPMVNQELVNGVKAAGFNAIRIPCSWNQYLVADEAPYTIKAEWLNRVQEVVNYAYAQDMYVIINIHWDGGWLECNANAAAQEAVIVKEKAIWTQIANHFADYGSRLIFAGNNEMRNKVGENENWGNPNEEEKTAYNAYNQAFVDAVRATGGKNATRNLVVQSWCCNPWRLFDSFTMPIDPAENHLMVECHYYDPMDYTHHADQTQYWGHRAGYTTETANQEDAVDELFAKLKAEFADKGYPVILGEYGTVRHSGTDAKIKESEAYYLEYVTRAARNNGISPFYWDNGAGNGMFGLFNRVNGSVTSDHMLSGIMKGVSEAEFPF